MYKNQESDRFYMKLVGTTQREVGSYLFDYYSVLHVICGTIGFIVSNDIYSMIFPMFSSMLLSFITIFIGSVVWELLENSVFVSLKTNRKKDDVLNSQFDTVCVFLGSIIGCYLDSNLLLVIYVIGILVVIYITLEIITNANSKKKEV